MNKTAHAKPQAKRCRNCQFPSQFVGEISSSIVGKLVSETIRRLIARQKQLHEMTYSGVQRIYTRVCHPDYFKHDTHERLWRKSKNNSKSKLISDILETEFK